MSKEELIKAIAQKVAEEVSKMTIPPGYEIHWTVTVTDWTGPSLRIEVWTQPRTVDERGLALTPEQLEQAQAETRARTAGGLELTGPVPRGYSCPMAQCKVSKRPLSGAKERK